MSPRQLSEQLEKLLSDDLYERQLTAIQSSIYSQILSEVKKLEVDRDLFIKQNQANRKRMVKINLLVDKALRQSDLKKSTERQVRKILKIDALNEEYFKSFNKFKPNKNYISSLQKQTIQEVNSYILKDGAQANFATPLKQILNRNINSGGAYDGFLEELKTFIKGEGTQGQLVKHANVWLRDTLFNYSRSYQQSVTADLGLEFYVYLGGLIKTSRDFCIERAGNYYHHNEIESWARLEWSGKKKGTTESSIFVFAGGHLCSHFIVPVSLLVIPDDVIQRNIKNGNYKPT